MVEYDQVQCGSVVALISFEIGRHLNALLVLGVNLFISP